jgi:hypothetical protein
MGQTRSRDVRSVGEHFDSPCLQATRVAFVGGFDVWAFPDVAEAALLVADDDDCLRGGDERERPQAESAGGDTDDSGFGCDSFDPARDLTADVVRQRHAQTQGCRGAP